MFNYNSSCNLLFKKYLDKHNFTSSLFKDNSQYPLYRHTLFIYKNQVIYNSLYNILFKGLFNRNNLYKNQLNYNSLYNNNNINLNPKNIYLSKKVLYYKIESYLGVYSSLLYSIRLLY
jgi:hypothetical protein